jgi:hypothetical protein
VQVCWCTSVRRACRMACVPCTSIRMHLPMHERAHLLHGAMREGLRRVSIHALRTPSSEKRRETTLACQLCQQLLASAAWPRANPTSSRGARAARPQDGGTLCPCLGWAGLSCMAPASPMGAHGVKHAMGSAMRCVNELRTMTSDAIMGAVRLTRCLLCPALLCCCCTPIKGVRSTPHASGASSAFQLSASDI